MQDRHFSDEELVAYLDGETDFAPSDAIDAALPKDAALRARIAALDIDRDALRDAFADLTPDRFILPAAPVRRNPLRMALTAAALVAALGLGFALGNTQRTGLNGWAEYVAAYQALYSSSTLANHNVTPEAQQAELDRVTAAIGKSISVDDLNIFPGVSFARSQVLSFEGRALIQLAFLNSTGEPVALCIIRSEEQPAAKSPEVLRMEGLSTALWSQNGYDYILIGGQDEELIARMSATFSGMSI